MDLGCSSEIDPSGRVVLTEDAILSRGRRFIVLADNDSAHFWNLSESRLSRWREKIVHELVHTVQYQEARAAIYLFCAGIWLIA
jgi:hypothetical protein